MDSYIKKEREKRVISCRQEMGRYCHTYSNKSRPAYNPDPCWAAHQKLQVKEKLACLNVVNKRSNSKQNKRIASSIVHTYSICSVSTLCPKICFILQTLICHPTCLKNLGIYSIYCKFDRSVLLVLTFNKKESFLSNVIKKRERSLISTKKCMVYVKVD